MNDRNQRLIIEVGGIATVVASLMLVVFEMVNEEFRAYVDDLLEESEFDYEQALKQLTEIGLELDRN